MAFETAETILFILPQWHDDDDGSVVSISLKRAKFLFFALSLLFTSLFLGARW